jgi:hypothetical protein
LRKGATRKKIGGAELGLTGQDEGIRRALVRFAESIDRSARELVEVLQLGSSSSTGSTQAVSTPDQHSVSPTSKPVTQSTQPVPKSPALIDPADLDRLPWTVFNSGNGAWIKSDLPAASALKIVLERANKPSTDIAGFHYKLSGQDRQFINRFKARSVP